MTELKLFTHALGLNAPWEVVDIAFSKDRGRLDLSIDFTKGALFPCPSCGKENCAVHDTKDRTWRHLNFFQYETYIHARMPRVSCGTCGIKQVTAPWARPGSGFTLLFELLVLQLGREMSITAVGAQVKEHSNRIWRILEHYVERARKNADLSQFRVLGIDEFSLRKGHNYMTAFSDIDNPRVVYVAETRRKEVIGEFAADMRERGYDPGSIDLICCDMWDPYLNGIKHVLPNANVVFDRFHIMKQMNEAIDKVRREEQQQNPYLKKSRYLWLKNPNNLTTKQSRKMAELNKLNLKTARAYQIKLTLSQFWEIPFPREARSYLKKWYYWATHSRLQPIIEVARTIKRYWDGVLHYTLAPITNGVVEGLNSKIKTAMKRAYGFKEPRYLKTIVYLVAGRLCFD